MPRHRCRESGDKWLLWVGCSRVWDTSVPVDARVGHFHWMELVLAAPPRVQSTGTVSGPIVECTCVAPSSFSPFQRLKLGLQNLSHGLEHVLFVSRRLPRLLLQLLQELLDLLLLHLARHRFQLLYLLFLLVVQPREQWICRTSFCFLGVVDRDDPVFRCEVSVGDALNV